MYPTLLSYEIRSRACADARILAALAAVAAATLGVIALGIPGLSGSATTLAYIICIATPVGFAVIGMSDYWKTLYGQRGYFTMSLPASGASIFWAKVTRIFLESLVALIFTIGGIIATASVTAWRNGLTLTEYTANFRAAFAIFPTSVLVMLAIGQIVSTFGLIVQACAVMTIGAEGRFNHMGFGAPIIGFIILYLINQVLSGVGTLFSPLSVNITTGRLSTEIMWTSFISTINTDESPNVIGVGAYVLFPLFALALGIWASRSIEKHTSLR